MNIIQEKYRCLSPGLRITLPKPFASLKNSEVREFGECGFRRPVLEAWDKLERGELS
ncbi:MAG: hypothetical protein Q8L93_11835 [Rhodocyclaceae bacterium]|nr:hypothetical protein [Rhodocyclaceae bacterium]